MLGLGLSLTGLSVRLVGSSIISNPVPATDLTTFASDGVTYPWYTATSPNAIYDADTNKTWVAWEGWRELKGRTERVRLLDHATLRWGAAYDTFVSGVVNDDHGAPALCFDHQGHVHLFGGAHATPLMHASTSSPKDPSTFVNRANIGPSDAYGYPHPSCIGGVIYVFMRENRGDGMPLVLRKTTALDAGVATWGAEQTVALHPSGGRCYQGTHVIRGTDIIIPITGGNYADTERRDTWIIVYDTLTGNVRNLDGSVTTLAANLPLTLGDSYKVVDQTTTSRFGGFALIQEDAIGDLHLAYSDGAASGTATFSLMHKVWNGSAWSAAVSVATTGYQHNGMAIVPLADGSVELYYSANDGTHDRTRGGDIWRSVWTSGGGWTAPEKLMANRAEFALDYPVWVQGANADCRVLWGECTQNFGTNSPTDEGKVLRCYAYGDQGLVGRNYEAPVVEVQPSISGAPNVGQDLTTAFRIIGDPAPTLAMQWKRDGVDIAGATSATYTTIAADEGTTLTFHVTASNVAGSATATPASIGPIGAVLSGIFEDSFNRADENLEASADWVLINGNAGGAAIRSNQLAALSTTTTLAVDSYYRAATSPGSPNHFVEANIQIGSSAMLMFRMESAGNGFSFRMFGNNAIRVHRVTDGTNFVTLTTYTHGSNINGSLIRAEISGDTITVLLDGVPVISGLSAGGFYPTAQDVGLFARAAVNNPWIDNFRSGPLA